MASTSNDRNAATSLARAELPACPPTTSWHASSAAEIPAVCRRTAARCRLSSTSSGTTGSFAI
ncbi:hypothetical protein DL89DRAFT_265953 [Linderina pennispora]|uniref:Uncharacterized protein n=1 Tax=Linderina pennispora TaxID=61395 RepID=A0A1Y1WFX3_9FUNG|nr:uncharacterized protein DL89DRAFT_265953 [Linderina pennispora]ORX72387.1 hypothetical protein DL89DRAFT_265953 [Linderina pennispora]